MWDIWDDSDDVEKDAIELQGNHRLSQSNLYPKYTSVLLGVHDLPVTRSKLVAMSDVSNATRTGRIGLLESTCARTTSNDRRHFRLISHLHITVDHIGLAIQSLTPPPVYTIDGISQQGLKPTFAGPAHLVISRSDESYPGSTMVKDGQYPHAFDARLLSLEASIQLSVDCL